MKDITSSEVRRTLLDGHSAEQRELAKRVDTLIVVVLDLMTEVEALRDAQVTGSRYHDSYRSACILTHNSAGPSTGLDKLLDCFYPEDRFSDGRVWRESVLMRRLGYTPAEIDAFRRDATEAEMYT